MDLGAFLRTGADLPITMAGEEQTRPLPGRLLERRRKPFWISPAAYPVGLKLVIRVKLPAYELASDGSLKPSVSAAEAELNLLGRVTRCRFFRPWNQYVLRLELLGRIYP